MISQLYPLGHLLLAIAELFLIGWSIRLWLQSNSLAMIVLPVILISLSYDNLVLASGTLLGEGQLLQLLSQIRFLVHYLCLPFLIVVGFELANRAGAGWAIPIVRISAWILALGLGITDILTRYIGLELQPVYFAGMLRYTAKQTSPPIITIVVTIVVLLIGLGFWIRTKGKWSWLFFGTLVALIGNALPISQFGTLIGSTSEFLMTLALLFTERYSERQLPDLGLDPDSDLLFKYIYKNWVLIHPEPKGVVYFIGGAGFGSFPTVFYRYILRRVFQEGYTIIALPFRFTLNHWLVALNLVKNAKPLREAIKAEAERRNGIYGEGTYKNLELYSDPQKFREGDYFWLGHSLGCKYVALLEVLGDVKRLGNLCSKDGDVEQISALLGECITNEKQIKKIQKAIAQIKDPEYVSLENQSSILMAPVITGIEGAIPIKAIADLVKNFIDARPSKEETECLIKKDENGVKDNLFHFTSIVKFKNDDVEAKAGTIQFLLDNLPTEPQPPLFKELDGKHLAPLNISKKNEKLADLLIEWLPMLKDRVKGTM
ncbi:Protein of unknown function (DUF1350) [Xenococcus sp. PCC 7305]|uniref:DUF1350 family protein n=1 Tax=Xenococcus sp. PCC 7305 TaxID=102125 RepID=UPI0002AC9056|nr:DUF1350 family protein [Xenococcus sp. PCC 7305]ELS03309.1 Protein of unknown function (DUF1350) [Xenococcus sp. PCC 7305]